MPIFRLTQPFDAFHGTVTGQSGDSKLVLYSTAKSAGVARQWVVPANPQSTNQMIFRGYQIAATAAYSGLTAAQAALWTEQAELLNYTNILNLDYSLSGVNLFVMINFYRQLRGIAILEDVPTIDKPPIPISVTSVTRTSATVLTVVASTVGLLNADFAMLRVSPPLSSAVRQARSNDVRIIGATLATSVVHPVSEVCTWTRTVPTGTYTVGDHVGVEITPLSADHFPGDKLLEPNITLI